MDDLNRTVGCLAVGMALALQTGCTTHRPAAAQLQPLQGTWEEVKAGEKATVTITGNSLHFHRDSNFWFKTKFTLPAGPGPQQLHATIRSSSPPEDSKGKVVVAIFKIEGGTLTLASEPQKDSKAFEEPSMFHHKLRKVGELERLQGTWEGVEVGYESRGKLTITITGNSLHYQGTGTNGNDVFDATFTLPTGTNPQQLHASLTSVPPVAKQMSPMAIGDMVPAVFKIEDGTLTMADEPVDGGKPFVKIKRFHYKLRKIQPQEKHVEASPSK